MSHRRAKRIRKLMINHGFHPKEHRRGYQYTKRHATKLPTLKELHLVPSV